MKQFQCLTVFMQAMKNLFQSFDFLKIKEPLIQIEILNAIQGSIHYQLLENLEHLYSLQKRGDTDIILDDQVLECVVDTINQLKV